MPLKSVPLKSIQTLRTNVSDLLATHRIQQKSLAEALDHDKSWINKFLRGARQQITLVDLEGIAAFFGVEVWQLFVSGAAAHIDRRRGGERRNGQDRRVLATSGRSMVTPTALIVTPRRAGGNRRDQERRRA